MPRKKSIEVRVLEHERSLLHRQARNPLETSQATLRADIVLRAAQGQTNYGIAKELGISRNTVKLWRYRFARERLAGLKPRPIPGRPKKTPTTLDLAGTS